jgi:acyl-CoA synthetase (AMP-forming)/AMP-acid ligase II
VELEGIDADLRPLHANARQRAVTEHILALADQAGYGAALIDAAARESVLTWPQFAYLVRGAARGLSRRGLQEGDTAGIFVDDAVSHAVAVHAVRAAGATAVPIGPAQSGPAQSAAAQSAAAGPARSAADVAAQLKQGRARLLITSPALADLAIEAAERSWVRQVFAFGEAEGTTPFDSLLESPRLESPRPSQIQANGHNGQPAEPMPEHLIDLTDAEPVAAQLIRRPVPQLTSRDVVVAAPPCGDPQGYTALLDLALSAGATIVAAPLAQVTAALGIYKGTAAIVPKGTDIPALPAGRVLVVG